MSWLDDCPPALAVFLVGLIVGLVTEVLSGEAVLATFLPFMGDIVSVYLYTICALGVILDHLDFLPFLSTLISVVMINISIAFQDSNKNY